ncbi:MAG: nitroreductase family protein [Novosphingobium sp.]
MSRIPDHPIEQLFIDRWSPRSFADEPVADEVLASAFEAARWAPSAHNGQPWRFVVARRGDAAWGDFLSFLMPFNRDWAEHASALIAIISAQTIERRGERSANGSHSFDAGAAWANFAHQALLLGWHTHGIGGFDRESARRLLQVPDDHALEAVVALGRRGPAEALREDLRHRETPNERDPVTSFVFAGRFGKPLFNSKRNAA